MMVERLQRQRIRRPPGDAALGADALEIPDGVIRVEVRIMHRSVCMMV